MIHQNKERPFLNLTAGSDAGYQVLTKACFLFLATTTAALTYSSYREAVSGFLPDWAFITGLAFTIIGLYVIIDHRLDGDLLDHWKTKDQLRNADLRIADKQSARRYLRKRGAVLWIRFALTLTSSIWAGSEISYLSTPPPDYDGYTTHITDHSERQAIRETEALASFRYVQSRHSGDVSSATRSGKRLVAAAVASGNPDQRSMYARNPGYFSPPPRGKWYATNLAYAKRIDAARTEQTKLLAAATADLTEAKGALARVQGSLASDSTATAILSLARHQVGSYDATLASRTNFIILLDVVAALLGLLGLRIRYLRLKAAGWEEPAAKRNVYSLIAQWRDAQWESFLSQLEEWLGLDIDGNGTIGTTGMTATPPASAGFQIVAAQGTPPQPAPIPAGSAGFFFRRSPTPSPQGTPLTPAPASTPVTSVATGSYGVTSNIVATPAPNPLVATNAPQTVATPITEAIPPPDAVTRLNGWKSMMSSYNSYMNPTRKETEIVLNRRADLLDGMACESRALAEMGWAIDKREGRTGAYFLRPV
ncbi:hypothetical protein [Neolewinella antarctica]|uniref:SMODS and SLOG-associating 2TM effector domain-containing protein n=1 Tax=Neolewinella antarctica TaxID=442734 RepID=A0ABX0X731_9BACT|nr:hypothetical protein [Neolewinella antarctica]NJC24823.1 hypothetical protein [Neolewinella antarctica]